MEFLQSINIVTIISVLTSIVGTAALIATVTPTQKDDEIIGRISKVVHFLAANFGQARNKD